MNTQIIERPTLADLFCLGHSIEILIPSTVDAVQTADSNLVQSVVDYVADKLAEAYGGSRVKLAETGRWISQEHGRILEPCIPVVAYAVDLDESLVVELMHYVKDTMNQESVFAVVDGKAYLA